MQLRNRGQQLASQTILGYESVDTLQSLLRNVPCSGQHDNWRLWPKPSHFDGKVMTAHLWHGIVDDYNINRIDGSQFQSLAAAGRVKTPYPKLSRNAFSQSSMSSLSSIQRTILLWGLKWTGEHMGPIKPQCPHLVLEELVKIAHPCSYLSSLGTFPRSILPL